MAPILQPLDPDSAARAAFRRARHGRARPGLLCLVATLVVLAVFNPSPGYSQEAQAGEIQGRLERLQRSGSLSVGGDRIERYAALGEAYAAAAHAPIWSERSAAELRRAIADAANDGLDPADYHLSAIDRLDHGEPTAANLADLDLLRTDAFLRLANDLEFGRIDPATGAVVREIGRPVGGMAAGEMVRTTAARGDVTVRLAALRPDHFVYTGLRGALAEHRRIFAAGGWRTLPNGEPLRLGEVDARVALLRERLAGSGDLPRPFAGSDSTFDQPLVVPIQVAHLWGGADYSAGALEAFAEAFTSGSPISRNLYFDLTEVEPAMRGSVERAAEVAGRMREIGMDRMLYGSDMAAGGTLPPAAGWARFRGRMPLTESELRTIAENVAPWVR